MGYTSSRFWDVLCDETRFIGADFTDCLQFLSEQYGVTLDEEELADCDSVGFLKGDRWKLVCLEADITPIKKS